MTHLIIEQKKRREKAVMDLNLWYSFEQVAEKCRLSPAVPQHSPFYCYNVILLFYIAVIFFPFELIGVFKLCEFDCVVDNTNIILSVG